MSALTNPAPAPVPPVSAPPPATPPGLPRRPRSWLWLAGLVILAGAAWLFYAVNNEQKVQEKKAATVAIRTVKARLGPLERSVRLAGQTSARKYANIVAPLLRGPESRNSLYLLKVAKPGAFIRTGELLAQIDAQAAQDHIDDVNDIVQAAVSDVRKLKAQQVVAWENLQQTLRVTKSDWDKWKLDAQAAETKTPVDQELLKLGVDEAQARYQQSQQDLPFTRQSQAAQMRVLELTVERHKRHLGRHLTDIKRYTVHAPMEGLVVMQSLFRGGEMAQIQEGDQVYPGMLFMKVVDVRTMQVEANINQAESGDFRLGQEATIGLDAFPGLAFKGKVYSIGALATRGWRENYYIRNIPVRIQIEGGADPRLIPDLSAYAEVKLQRIDKAVIVPLAALRRENGKTFVELKNGESWEKRQVKAGLANQIDAAINEGLSEGDEVRLMY